MRPLAERFDQAWNDLARIGRPSGSGGYRRFAWTSVDDELRAWFRNQAVARGLQYDSDRNGNQWAWWGEPVDGAVVTGSHLDSVPDGGAFDGPLGVVSGFLAVEELRSRGVQPDRPIAVVNCVEEEGARFGIACMGSRLLTGALDPDTARALKDKDGVSLDEAMRVAGADPGKLGRDAAALGRIGTFVELHVEQGRALADLDAPIGVATAIWPHGRWRCEFRGEANHAGTTRLPDRRDPMLAFAATVLAAREVAERAGAVATVGKALIVPNGTNAIPSAVDAWLDARAADDATLTEVVARIADVAQRSAAAHDATATVTLESYAPAVRFDNDLRGRISEQLGDVPPLPTGAGHDAGVLAAEVPAAMLFVRNPSGTSHSPAEHAEAVDCVAGVTALATVLEELACR